MKRLRVFVPQSDTLAEGRAAVFHFRRGRHRVEGFVLRAPHGLVAFANECPHWHVDLDMGDSEFWDATSGRILCKNHGALFHPESGVCELGPCVGLALEHFELERDGEGVWVEVPEAEPEEEEK